MEAEIKNNLLVMFGRVGAKCKTLRNIGCNRAIAKRELADEADSFREVGQMFEMNRTLFDVDKSGYSILHQNCLGYVNERYAI